MSVEHAPEINRQNGITLWQDSTAKKMYNFSVAFKILKDDENLPVEHTQSSRHLVFVVKMNFKRKAVE